jgi:hypothetical protein
MLRLRKSLSWGWITRCCIGRRTPASVDRLTQRLRSGDRYNSGKTVRKSIWQWFERWRATGPEADVEILLSEALTRPASSPSKEIFAVCVADVATVRGIVDDAEERLFCVYDQTVSRLDGVSPPVATHANIFLRLPPPKTEARTRLRKDYAGRLRDSFLRRTVPAANYKDGLCLRLNRRAADGEFDC